MVQTTPQTKHSHVKVIKTSKGTVKLVKLREQYDERIRGAIESKERILADNLNTQLIAIYHRVVDYLRILEVGNTTITQKNVRSVVRSLFPNGAMNVSTNLLMPLVDIGIQYQVQLIEERFNEQGLTFALAPTLLTPVKKAVQSDPQVGFDFAAKNVKFVDALKDRKAFLDKTLDKTTFDYLTATITQGIKEGKTYAQIANDVEQYANGKGDNKNMISYDRAKLIAQTESNWALNDGTRLYAKGLGVEKYNISLAPSACIYCQNAAYTRGIGSPLREYSINNGRVLPVHPRCRCTFVSVIPTDWFSDPEKATAWEKISNKKGSLDLSAMIGNSDKESYKRVTAMPSGVPVNNVIGDQIGLSRWANGDDYIELYHGQNDDYIPSGMNETMGKIAKDYGLQSGAVNSYGQGLYVTTRYNEAASYAKNKGNADKLDPSVYKVYIKKNAKVYDFTTSSYDDPGFQAYKVFEQKRRLDIANQLIADAYKREKRDPSFDANEEATKIAAQYPTSQEALFSSYIQNQGYDAIRAKLDFSDYYAIFDTTDKFIINTPDKVK